MKQKSLTTWFYVLTCSMLMLSQASIAATTYHVSPNGLDNNPGTQSQPWSLHKANQALQSGDTAILHAGTYSIPVTAR